MRLPTSNGLGDFFVNDNKGNVPTSDCCTQKLLKWNVQMCETKYLQTLCPSLRSDVCWLGGYRDRKVSTIKIQYICGICLCQTIFFFIGSFNIIFVNVTLCFNWIHDFDIEFEQTHNYYHYIIKMKSAVCSLWFFKLLYRRSASRERFKCVIHE